VGERGSLFHILRIFLNHLILSIILVKEKFVYPFEEIRCQHMVLVQKSKQRFQGGLARIFELSGNTGK
jgi:hypothetical protein